MPGNVPISALCALQVVLGETSRDQGRTPVTARPELKNIGHNVRLPPIPPRSLRALRGRWRLPRR
eukprot:2182004-Prymnesium_polylepis.1